MAQSTPTSTLPSPLDEAARALFRLGRTFRRLPLSALLEQPSEDEPSLSSILVVQTIEDGWAQQQEVSVKIVADGLGVDPSTASRLVTRAVEKGYVRRQASQLDGRATVLALTEAGLTLAVEAGRYQRSVFDAVTREWSEQEREEFARLFARFAEALSPNQGKPLSHPP